MDFVYKFPVVKGIQAGHDYYIAMIPLKMLAKLFPDDEEYVLPEYRAQRKLNTSRIPVISKYILENDDSYVFSALAASIDGEFKFIESSDCPNTGILEVSMDARFLINDGQHRKAAILSAIEENSELGQETISVVLYEDLGLRRSQQIFTDLNKHAVKTSNSISELYDSRDDLAVITRNAVMKVPFINEYTDKEKDILGKYSSNLFTLNAFYSANKRVVAGRKITESTEDFLVEFWSTVANHIVQWNELTRREISKVDLRENYLVTQGVVIQALGRIGAYFYENESADMESTLSGLEQIDWRRSANQWKLRAIRANGRMITSDKAILLTANVIKKNLNIKLNDDEKRREKEFNESCKL